MDADEADLGALRDSLTRLDQIFLVCTVGEFNAGKSSFINALLGSDQCEVGVLPTTSSINLLSASGAAWLRDTSVALTSDVRARRTPLPTSPLLSPLQHRQR